MSNEASTGISNPIMRKWINASGLVDYNLIKTDDWFWEQIKFLEEKDLKDSSRNEELAFWLNSYNLLTIKSVLLELERNPLWKGNVGVVAKVRFFMRKFRVAGKKLNLNYIEHQIIRRKFKEPRVHFALNCASKGCPFLPGFLFKAETLEKALDHLASFFINSGNVSYNTETYTLTLSKILKWYSRDFKEFGGVIAFIQKYWKEKQVIPDDAKIIYDNYDWNLNSQE